MRGVASDDEVNPTYETAGLGILLATWCCCLGDVKTVREQLGGTISSYREYFDNLKLPENLLTLLATFEANEATVRRSLLRAFGYRTVTCVNRFDSHGLEDAAEALSKLLFQTESFEASAEKEFWGPFWALPLTERRKIVRLIYISLAHHIKPPNLPLESSKRRDGLLPTSTMNLIFPASKVKPEDFRKILERAVTQSAAPGQAEVGEAEIRNEDFTQLTLEKWLLTLILGPKSVSSFETLHPFLQSSRDLMDLEHLPKPKLEHLINFPGELISSSDKPRITGDTDWWEGFDKDELYYNRFKDCVGVCREQVKRERRRAKKRSQES